MAGKEIGDHFGLLYASTSRIIKERGALMRHVEIQDLTPLSRVQVRRDAGFLEVLMVRCKMIRSLPYILVVLALLAPPMPNEGAAKSPCKGAELKIVASDDSTHFNGQAMVVMARGKTRLTIRLDTYTNKEVRYKLSFEPDSALTEEAVQGLFGEVIEKYDAFTLYQESSTRTEYRFAFAIVAKDRTRIDVYCEKEFVENCRIERSDKGVFYIRTIDEGARQQLEKYYGIHGAVKFGACLIRVFEGDCRYLFQAALPWPDAGAKYS
jgi:hypothetical protein